MAGRAEDMRERQLIDQVLAGRAAAFDTLIAAHEAPLRALIRHACCTRPEVDADEVLQEVRLYVFRRLDRYDPHYPFRVFAQALARNVIKRFLVRRSDLAPPPRDQELAGIEGEALAPSELERLPIRFRAVLGDGRFPAPDRGGGPSREFLELFELYLRYGGYPHQQVAFGYSIMVWGKAKQERGRGATGGVEKVPVTGDPDLVVREIGPEPLAPAADAMLADIRGDLRLDGDYLRRARRPLDRRLRMTCAELFARDRASQQIFRHLGDRLTGETRLADYFGRDPRKSVADWTRAVRERVRRAFMDPASRERSVLPGAAPPTGSSAPTAYRSGGVAAPPEGGQR